MVTETTDPDPRPVHDEQEDPPTVPTAPVRSATHDRGASSSAAGDADPGDAEGSGDSGADGDAEGTEGTEDAADVVCPRCGAAGAAGSRFCEECGAPIDGEPDPAAQPDSTGAADELPEAPSRPCVRCGGRVADDGYCEECGAPAVSERDHFEVTASPTVGGVCDRGVVHARNEDALALGEAGGVVALVVCDGVSSAPASDAASLAASEAALATLLGGAPGGEREVDAEGAARTSAWAALLTEAAERANEAVVAVPTTHVDDAPSCTYVAAVVDGARVVVASVGDSRAYWLPDRARAVRLTVDDSWAQEMAEMGVHVSQVRGSAHAHAITRWLGADAPELRPRHDTVTVAERGWLLLCSDGLWNYCEDADELGSLVRRHAAEHDGDATATARALVEWANAQGGRDNVTVALARLGG